MPSQIDNELSEKERVVLAMYRSPGGSGMRQAIRLTLQYALGAGIFVYLAIDENEPRYSLAVFAVLALSLVVRLMGASKIAGVMPGVIEKYERRIATLTSAGPTSEPAE